MRIAGEDHPRLSIEMGIGGYEPGIEDEIGALFDTREGRRGVLDAWRWRHVDAPGAFSEPAVVVARAEGHVIGFAAATRADLVVNGQVYPAAQTGLGGLGRSTGDADLDAEMIDALVERAKAAQMAYLYIAAPEVDRPFFEQLGFEFLFEVYARNLYIGLEGLSSRLSKRALSPFRKFAKEARRIRTKMAGIPIDDAAIEQIARLIANDESPTPFGVDKTAAYLGWRYRDDPRFDYELLTYRKNAGQGVDSFAVVRRFRSDTGRTVLHVDEQWTRQDGRRTNAKLFGELAMLGLTEEADVLRCFAVAGTSREQALLGLGCIRKKVERTFMIKRLIDDAPALDVPIVAKDVRLSAGDLELYDA